MRKEGSKSLKKRAKKLDFSEGQILVLKKLGVSAYAAVLSTNRSTHWNDNLRIWEVVFEKYQCFG